MTGGRVPTTNVNHTNPDHDGDHDHDDVDDEDPGDPLDVSMGTGFGMRRCETINGDPVDPDDVVAAALIGHVRVVVVDRRGVVVNAGRKTRLFRGVARELVWLLGKTCSWRGCDHHVDLQIDHLDEYVRDDGGNRPSKRRNPARRPQPATTLVSHAHRYPPAPLTNPAVDNIGEPRVPMSARWTHQSRRSSRRPATDRFTSTTDETSPTRTRRMRSQLP